MPVSIQLLFLLVASFFSSVCQGHPEVHPLSSLRHERSTVKFGKSLSEIFGSKEWLLLLKIVLDFCGSGRLHNIMLTTQKDVHAD